MRRPRLRSVARVPTRLGLAPWLAFRGGVDAWTLTEQALQQESPAIILNLHSDDAFHAIGATAGPQRRTAATRSRARPADSVMMLVSSGARLGAPGHRYAVCLAERMDDNARAEIICRHAGSPAAGAQSCPEAPPDEGASLGAHAE